MSVVLFGDGGLSVSLLGSSELSVDCEREERTLTEEPVLNGRENERRFPHLVQPWFDKRPQVPFSRGCAVLT